jgi:hypothetical protein
MEILKYNTQDGRISFAIPELADVKEFKMLFRSDRGMKGDHDGRDKIRAYAELGVIWWINEPNSPGIRKGYSDKDLLNDARKNFMLPDDWKPTAEFKNANTWYKEHRASIGKETYQELIRAIGTAKSYVGKVREKLETKLDNPNLEDAELKVVGGLIDKLLEIASTLPSRLKSLKDAESLIDAEAKERGNTIRGGANEEVTDSMRGHDM